MRSAYLIWAHKDVPNACALSGLLGVDKQYELLMGIQRQATFPNDAMFRMNPDFPHDTLLTDSLLNTDMMIVVSLRLKEYLHARELKNVEYLPVTILNHKQKAASRDYFIIHPIEPVDCLDIEKCVPMRSRIDPETIMMIKRLVIDEHRVDPEREFFRPKFYPRITMVRRELAEAIDGEGFTGIRWVELEDYPRPRSTGE